MRHSEWDSIIQAIADECNHDRVRADKVLMAWRAKLAKEPHLLAPFQIDEIVRDARQRLTPVTGGPGTVR